jgi:glucuronosyltransferase
LQELKKFMDEAPDGVIYFSTGSHMNSSELNENTIEALITAFSKLKQRVLWKWNGAPMSNKPDNVLLQDWLPQIEILSKY